MDLSQYLEIFIDESKEHLQTLNDQVLILESEPENVDTVNEIFRAAHSLKGMAGTMGYKRMQRLTHDMENVFSEIRNGKMNVNADLVDIVFKCLDALEGYLTNIIETSDEGTDDNDELIAQLNAVLQNGLAGSGEAQAAATKEETKEEKKPEGGDRRKYLSIPLADFEKNAISEAKAQGMHVYATTVHKPEVFDALNKIDNNILKLDTIDTDYIRLTDRPTGHYDVRKIIKGMKAFKGNLIIQTMFMKGKYQGQDVDNTSDRYVLPWLETVKEIAPRQVMIYTIDRETPDHDLEKATHEELDRIGKLIKDSGIPVSVSY